MKPFVLKKLLTKVIGVENKAKVSDKNLRAMSWYNYLWHSYGRWALYNGVKMGNIFTYVLINLNHENVKLWNFLISTERIFRYLEGVKISMWKI